MELVTSFLGRNGFLPHGYCFTWTPAVLWTMVTADALIALAYFSIPVAIVRFARARPDWSMNWLALLFGAFIFACGTTHVMDIWTIWQPDYGWQAVSKAATAVVSVATAAMLWPLIPRALKIPSVQQLQAVIDSLETEMQRRRSTEDLLADVQHNLATTLASIGAGFIATDAQGRVTRMNAVAEDVTGWTQAQAAGQSLWAVFVREDRPAQWASMNPLQVLIDQHVTVDVPHRVVAVARGGRRTPLEVRADLTRDAAGELRGMVAIFRDMTRQNLAEAESAELAAIVESSSDAIIGKTLDGRITSWNRAAEATFGYTAQEAVGQPAKMLIPADRVDEDMRLLAQLTHGERVPPFSTVRRTRSGELIEVSLSISPIRDAEGRIVGAAKIARDMSLERRAQAASQKAERLEAENHQIMAASRMKSLFLANMSHELRTPLNAVIGFADLLHAGVVPHTSPKHHEFLGHIATSGRHLLQLINDVLDLAKVESGKFEFTPEPVNLPRLVSEVSGILHTALQRKHVELHVDIDPAVDELVIDPARLKQVLYNYLSNAIKFSGESGQVMLRARPQGPAHMRLEVQDSGIGIAPGDIQNLFIEFQQLDGSLGKRKEGTGLGLALTRRLVQAQGGRVGVRSTPGAGSVFHLVLPLRHGDTTPLPDDDAPPQRLLVIETPGPAQARLVQQLSQGGFEVDAAGSAQQALQQAAANGYGALTLGLRLPDRGGLDLLAGIRAGGSSSQAPVVAVTVASPTGAAAAFAISDVLRKPLQAAEVAAALSALPLGHAGSARVMVIDDDPLARELMCSTLRAIGNSIEPLPFAGGREALAQLERDAPDAIVLDLVMPEFDGFATLDALRRMPRWRATPVFIWTSLMLSDDEYATLARSAQGILAKGGGQLGALLGDLGSLRGTPPAPVPGAAPVAGRSAHE